MFCLGLPTQLTFLRSTQLSQTKQKHIYTIYPFLFKTNEVIQNSIFSVLEKIEVN